MRTTISVVALLLAGPLAAAVGQEPKTPAPPERTLSPEEEAVHDELRAFRKEMTAAINANDLDKLLSLVTDDVVVTWQNGEVSRTPAGVRAYYDRMMKGDKRIVQSITTDPQPDDLTHLFGDVGISAGSSNDRFVLTDGRDFTIATRWSAAVVKQNGQWKLASFHASTNMFDNPILWIAVRQTGLWVGGGALLAGVVVGAALMLFFKRTRQTTHAKS
ncbi:MAG: nuclear transport factor 2 family protein [Planctomycetia bacterium]|nr:nuclear transport factor 2 family protein [Planctomycetia bacterium]